MRRALPFLPLLAAALLSGCAPKFQTMRYIPKPNIHSVVSLSPSTTEIIGTIQPQLLTGKTASDDYPTSIRAEIVASVKPDYERIKALNPDLILYDSTLYSPEDIAKIKALGFKTFEVNADTVQDFEKQLYEIASMIGSQTFMEDNIIRIDEAVSKAEADKPSPTPKVAVIMPGRGGPMMISGTKGFIADVVHIAGGDPVGPAVDKFVPVNPETLVSDNPDVIVLPTTGGDAADDVKSLLNNPALRSINAIKNQRIGPIDEDVALRRGARVDKFVTGVHTILTAKGTL